MTVQELIELLKAEDQDALVCVSSDEEGNTIRTVCEPLGSSKACQGDWSDIDLIHPEDENEYDDDEKFDVVTIYP